MNKFLMVPSKSVGRITWITLIAVMMLVLVTGCKKTTQDDTYADQTATQTVTQEATTNQASEDATEQETEATNAETTDAETDAAAQGVEQTVYPYEFVDKFGNTIVIAEEPKAIISFSPEQTETLFAIGKGTDMIGRSTYCDYPEAALALPDMGSLFDFNLEAVLDVKPDLVFLSSMVSEDVYKSLVDNGITVAVFDYDQSLAGTMTMIETVGHIVNRNAEAVSVNAGIQGAIDDIAARAANREPKSVYYAVSVGDYTSAATGDTFINDIITTIGATNAAADGTFWMYTVEQLVEKDPDFVICSQNWDMKATIESLDGYKDLTAVKEGRLVEVDENIFSRQGPRVVDALYALENIVYGE